MATVYLFKLGAQHTHQSLASHNSETRSTAFNQYKQMASRKASFFLAFFSPSLSLSLAACMQHIGLIWLWSARSKQMIPLVAIGRRAIWRLFYVLVEKKQFLSSLFHEYSRSGANVGF
jgi:hypothetical protein